MKSEINLDSFYIYNCPGRITILFIVLGIEIKKLRPCLMTTSWPRFSVNDHRTTVRQIVQVRFRHEDA
jgi:hypothetical protein